ncbi:MAG TPA: dihydrodipicolinate synthase family protein [Bauldia sp.]|nr:dihydrodipicolinate synthase family protein [Bauldia sp.]
MKISRQTEPPAVPQGVYAATITPRRDGEVEVDLGAMLDVIDFVTSRGVNGVCLFGSTGEFLHYTAEERSRFIGLATKRSRVPVLANISHSTLDGAIAMAEEAAGAGVAGVLAMPPYFFRYDPGSIRQFFLELAAQVTKWTPVYLYNIPVFSNPIPLDTAVELLESGAFAGIKDSGGDWEYLYALIRVRERVPVRVLCGDDRLFRQARQYGADAGISGVASAAPELMAALSRAVDSGDTARIEHLEARVNEFIDWISRFPVPVGVREAARLRGIKTGSPAVPPGEEGRTALAQFQPWFRDWIKVIEHECKP